MSAIFKSLNTARTIGSFSPFENGERRRRFNPRTRWILIFFFGAGVFGLPRAWADPARKLAAEASSRSSGVRGVILSAGATVYSAASFDGAKLAVLPPKTRVVMSRGTFGDEGPQFYKVKFKKNGQTILGYVLDSEIGPEKPGTLAARKPEPPESASTPMVKGPDAKVAGNAPKPPPKKHKRKRPKEPMLFSHYVGLVAGATDFKEKISGVNAEQYLTVYGIKITGPDLLFKGPITEFDFIVHNGAPSYYNKLSGIQPTGYVLWTDALLLYPFLNRQNAMAYFEIGPLLVVSDFKVLNGGKLMDLFAVDGGLSTGLAGAVRIGSIALRLEAKYMFENKSYLSLLGSIQSEF